MRKISIILFLNVLTFLNINSYGALDASVLEKIKLTNIEENQKDVYKEITKKGIIN
tara:strand:- start:52 stop:219 length:168 start_codon:yes stop_codon:yes gene_type:complete